MEEFIVNSFVYSFVGLTLLDIKLFWSRQAENSAHMSVRSCAGSRLLLLAQFLKAWIAAQRIKHGIEAEQRRSVWRLGSGRERDCLS